jgi:nitroreductase
MDAIEAIKTRRSVRAYQQRPISRDILKDLVDCGRLAPTAMNQQPWEFVVVTEAAMLRRLAELIGHAQFMLTAPAAIVVLCKPLNWYVEDASAATQNLLLAAQAHGMGSCWVAGDKQPYADAVRQALGAPEGYVVFSLVTLGYPAEAASKDKRPLDQVLHWERF